MGAKHRLTVDGDNVLVVWPDGGAIRSLTVTNYVSSEPGYMAGMDATDAWDDKVYYFRPEWVKAVYA